MSELAKIETNKLQEMERNLSYETAKFDLEQRRATALSKSAFFPDTMKGDVGSAVIIYDLAERMNISPMEVAQSIYIIYNKPSFSTAFLVARLNDSRLIKGNLQTIIAEDKQSAYCIGTDRETGTQNQGMSITMEIAKKEGWLSKKGSKWVNMPELMLRKRAQAFFIREFYPNVMFGTQTREEIIDTNGSNYINIDSNEETKPTNQPKAIAEPEAVSKEFMKQLISELENLEILISGIKPKYGSLTFSKDQRDEITKAGNYKDEQLTEIVEMIDKGVYLLKDFNFSLTPEQIEVVEAGLFDLEKDKLNKEGI